MAGGVALFLLGDAWFRQVLRIGTGALRAGAAVVALATIPLGTEVAAILQLAALIVLEMAAAGIEASEPRRRAQVQTS